MNIKKSKLYFCISSAFIVIASIMIALIQFVGIDGTKEQKTFSLIIAITFWVSLVCSQVFFWLVSFNRRKTQTEKNKAKIGLISFFQNKEAKIADLSMIFFAIVVIFLIIFNVDSGFLVTASVALLFLSFFMHCYLNSRNYKFIKNIENKE